MPVVLGCGRIGPGQADSPVGLAGHRRPHLLAVEQPAAVGPDRPGWSGWPGRSRPLARRTADTSAARRAGWGRPSGRAGRRRAAGDDRRECPRADADVRALDAGRGQLLVDDHLLDRPGVPTPGRGPVRHHQPGVHQGPSAVALRLAASSATTGASSARITDRPRSAGRRRASGGPRARPGRPPPTQ